MAQYKIEGYLHQSKDEAFDEIHAPGDPAPCSGIYHCRGCHREIVALYGQSLPPEDDHQHKQSQGHIGWRLIVTTG